MNKKLLLLIVLCLTMVNVFAQNFQFAYSTGTYAEIAGATPLLTGTGVFNDSITLPFSFTLSGVTNTKIQVLVNGRITTGSYSSQSDWFWAMEGAEVSHGIYSYATNGSAGNRITKIQFKNNWFDHEWVNGNLSRCNFQIWLYEKDSAVEVHYGPSNIVDVTDCYQGASGPVVGLPGLFAQGNASAPSGGSQAIYLNGTPPNGAIYRFGPPASGTNVAQYTSVKSDIILFPVPAHERLYIRSANNHPVNFDICDMTGRKMASYTNQLANTPIDISAFSNGLYILKTAEGVTLPFNKN